MIEKPKCKFVKYSSPSAILFGVLASFVPLNVNASTLSSALTVRDNFIFPQGNPDLSSYDGKGNDAFAVFSDFTSSTRLQMGSFKGQPQGSQLQAFNLLELAAYDGTSPAYANQFGVIDNDGNFFSMINSKDNTSLAEGNFTQATDQELRFGLLSPEGLFSSIDSENDDNATQIIAKTVEKDGVVTINKPRLAGGEVISFQLFQGDIILFLEDMKAVGNGLASGLVPLNSDYDYNDMVIVVRQSQIPEPTTMALLGSAIGGVILRRRKQISSQA
jgi:hypothetical protein